jgi:RNA polymerase sigma-70 factor (ECF subfamily)
MSRRARHDKEEDFDHELIDIAARLPAYFRRRVRDAATAQDLAQETLLKAYRARATLRDPSRIEPWVYRIAHATVADHYRKRSETVAIDGDMPSDAPSTASPVMEAIISSARCYLETLPSTYRDPVHLADYEGLPHSEVARQLRLSLAATKARIRRGKLMVRGLMEARCEFEYDGVGNIIGYQVRACALQAARG